MPVDAPCWVRLASRRVGLASFPGKKTALTFGKTGQAIVEVAGIEPAEANSQGGQVKRLKPLSTWEKRLIEAYRFLLSLP